MKNSWLVHINSDSTAAAAAANEYLICWWHRSGEKMRAWANIDLKARRGAELRICETIIGSSLYLTKFFGRKAQCLFKIEQCRPFLLSPPPSLPLIILRAIASHRIKFHTWPIEMVRNHCTERIYKHEEPIESAIKRSEWEHAANSKHAHTSQFRMDHDESVHPHTRRDGECV